MPFKKRRKAYLAKTKDAEEHAAKARTPENRAKWQKIAASSRELAGRKKDG
jgi:hypothetical protein